jgi:hypothetical protein
MKLKFFVICTLLFVVLFSVSGCNEDAKEFLNKEHKFKFSVPVKLMELSKVKQLPSCIQTSLISNVEITNTALTGGSIYVKFTSIEKLKTLYFNFKNKKEYFKYVITDTDLYKVENGTYHYRIFLRLSQRVKNSNLESLQIQLRGMQMNSRKCDDKELPPITIVEVGAGKLQISLTWDLTYDLDLHVTDPLGNHIWYRNKQKANGELDYDAKISCRSDASSENVYYKEPLVSGRYKVEVVLFNKCGIAGPGSAYVVDAFLNGERVRFSNNQEGRFADSDTNGATRRIGEIVIP